MSPARRLIKMLASIKLAVIVILAIAVISAVGTIYEARYDSEVAQKLVYHSVWMYIVMGALAASLIAVMIDRWPWRPHHAGFVLAHIGILILLLGAIITQKFGVDGSISFAIGQEKRNVVIRERDLHVWASLDGNNMRPIFSAEPDFLVDPPSEADPFVVNLGSDKLEFVEYHHFAFRESEILPGDDTRDPPAVRFQLENPNVNVTEWLRRDRSKSSSEIDLGPARVVLTEGPMRASGQNEILLTPAGDKALRYSIFDKNKTLKKSGRIVQGETLETGWMGLKFRLLRYLPRAREVVRYVPGAPSPLSNSAVRFRFRGAEYWLGLNSLLRLYLEDRVFLVSYGQRQLQLEFPLRLVDFRVGRYQGTKRAASYESEVEVPGRGTVLISMNEPLKHEGFTFYQASFEKDERGEPVASILSVNYDPGRWIKYLGSFLIVLGSVVLFYFKRVKRKSA